MSSIIFIFAVVIVKMEHKGKHLYCISFILRHIFVIVKYVVVAAAAVIVVVVVVDVAAVVVVIKMKHKE